MTNLEVTQQLKNTALNEIRKIFDPKFDIPQNYSYHLEDGSCAEQREYMIRNIIDKLERDLKAHKKKLVKDENKRLKEKQEHTIRKKIITEVKTCIKKEVKDFSTLQGGEQEQIQDKYIAIISEKYGLTLSEFYATDGKFLLKILK